MRLPQHSPNQEKRWWNQEKDDGFWLLWGIFNEYIEQNIIMVELRKANFHSVDIADWWKINYVKRISKTDSNFIFSKLQSCSLIFKKKECSVYYRILFTLNRF